MSHICRNNYSRFLPPGSEPSICKICRIVSHSINSENKNRENRHIINCPAKHNVSSCNPLPDRTFLLIMFHCKKKKNRQYHQDHPRPAHSERIKRTIKKDPWIPSPQHLMENRQHTFPGTQHCNHSAKRKQKKGPDPLEQTPSV